MLFDLNHIFGPSPFTTEPRLQPDSPHVATAAASLKTLSDAQNLGLSSLQCTHFARFIENKEHTATYLTPSMTGLSHTIEIDPETKNIYIHYLGSIGQGGFKTVTKSILYDREQPRVVANGEAEYTEETDAELKWNKKTAGMKGILPTLSIMVHQPNPLLQQKKISFITEYFQPGSLDDLHTKGIRLTTLEKMKVAHDIIRGVKNLHKKNIIHADLKPGNVFVKIEEGKDKTRQVSAVVADLGMAYLRNVHKKVEYAHATPCYKPPEGLVSNPSGSKAKYFDTYALGCTLYSLVHDGKRPDWIYNVASLEEKKEAKVSTRKDAKSVQKKVEKTIHKTTEKVKASIKEQHKKKLTPEQKLEKLIVQMVSPKTRKRGKMDAIHKKMTEIYDKTKEKAKAT